MAHEKEYLDKDKFLELQYNTLRKEIETRQDRHFKLAAGALLVVPAVQLLKLLPADTETGAAEIAFPVLLLLLASPLVVLSLYILYFSEHLSIMRCGRYIKEQIEAPIESAIPKIIGWETWLKKTPRIHESQQIIAFHFLYIPLYIIAAIAAAYTVTSQLSSWTAAFWLSVYGVVGVLAVLFVWTVHLHKGAEVDIRDDSLVINLRGIDRLCALTSRLEVHKACLSDAVADPEVGRERKGLMRLGICIPYFFAVGTYCDEDDKRTFWNVYDPENAIVIELKNKRCLELKDERYDRLVIEVEDPHATVASVQQTIAERQN